MQGNGMVITNSRSVVRMAPTMATSRNSETTSKGMRYWVNAWLMASCSRRIRAQAPSQRARQAVPQNPGPVDEQGARIKAAGHYGPLRAFFASKETNMMAKRNRVRMPPA
jgi:hypothetical protein